MSCLVIVPRYSKMHINNHKNIQVYHRKSRGFLHMKIPIDLSPKALKFIESRRKDLSIQQYINKVMENLFDETAFSSVTLDDNNVVEVIENSISYDRDIAQFQERHQMSAMAEPYGDYTFNNISQNVYDYLREVYKDRIPVDIFRKKCLERGMTAEDVNSAIRKYKDKLVKPEK